MYLDVSKSDQVLDVESQFLLFFEHVQCNERLQNVMDRMTDFEKSNCRIMLQLGMNTVLPLFEGYVEPPPPPPPPYDHPLDLFRAGEELISLPSDFSDAGSYLSLSGTTSANSGSREGVVTISSSDTAPEIEDVMDDLSVIEVVIEDRTIDLNDILSIYLLTPQGGPRYEIIARIGTISTTRKQRWLLKNGVDDPDLYQLNIDSNHSRFSYTINTRVLQGMLAVQAPLLSRNALFDLLEQRRYDHYTNLYIWRDRDVVAEEKRIRQKSTYAQDFFPRELKNPLGIRWVQKQIQSIQPLGRGIFVHLDQKRFLTDPINDFYFSSIPKRYSSGVYDVQFRGICLAHPSGTGKRRRIVDYLLHQIDISQKRVLILSMRAAECLWMKELQDQDYDKQQSAVKICHWEDLHQQTAHARVEHSDDYYGHFRHIVSESEFRKSHDPLVNIVDNPMPLYVELLGQKWDLIILDDAIGGIVGGRGKYWAAEHSPLYSYVQNLMSPQLICTASDYPTDTISKIRTMAGLLQCPTHESIHSQFSEGASAPLLRYVMDTLIYKISRQGFDDVLCPLNTSLHVLKMEFFETMAQPDYLNRYSSSPFDQDYGQVPAAKLAHILTCPPQGNLYQHQAHYQQQHVHTLEEAQQKFGSQNAYYLPLLDRKGVVHPTHESSQSKSPSHGNQHYLKSLATTDGALVDQFSCTLCLESKPSLEDDYVVTPCGHFMCWSCLSPWMHHMKTRSGIENEAATLESTDFLTPCLACKTPICNETIIRYNGCKQVVTPTAKRRKISNTKSITNTVNITSSTSIIPKGKKSRTEKAIVRVGPLSKLYPPLTEAEKIQEPVYQGLYGAKLQMLIPWLRTRCSQNQKIVLFTHHKTYSIDFFDILRKEHLPITRYMGAQKDKQRIVRMFTKKRNTPNGRILFLSSGIGYDNMDLSETTDCIVFLDNCYDTPMEQESAESALLGRIQRRNRTRPLEVVRLLIDQSTEQQQYKAYEKYCTEIRTSLHN